MLSTDGVLCTYQLVNQFPNTNHGILTPSAPVPIAQPKKRLGVAPPAAALPTLSFGGGSATPVPSFGGGNLFGKPAPAPNAVVSPSVSLSFLPQGKAGSTATPLSFSFGGAAASSGVPKPDNTASPFKFNFGGSPAPATAAPASSAPAPALLSLKFTAPVQPVSNPPALTKPHGSSAPPSNFSFNFSGNLGGVVGPGSGRASEANIAASTPEPAPTPKPMFNLAPVAASAAPPTFKNTGFSFTSQPPAAVEPSPKPACKSVNVETPVAAKPPAVSAPTGQSKFSFTPVARPLENASDPSKTLFQPVAQQQQPPQPVRPQVVSLANESNPRFGTPLQQQLPKQVPQQPAQHALLQRAINSPALATPNKPLLPNQSLQTPISVSGLVKDNETSPNPEIEQHAAKWNTTLQKNIHEEINNFNAELGAFMKSCDVISCEDLVGGRDELIEMKNDIASLTNHMDGYKGVMKENKSECAMLRENVLKNLKMLDEATLLKQKMEDKRYSSAMKLRPLDPISARQRKSLRAHVNQVEQLLNDINIALDTKWEERMAARKNARNNKTNSIMKRQQVYQTIEAIDQITDNLASRLKKCSLQSQENSLLAMNLNRISKSVGDASNATSVKDSPSLKNHSKSMSCNSPMKMEQLKSFLNNRGQTPVRKSKPYTSLSLPPPRESDQTVNPSFSSFPKAASTPFLGADILNKPKQPISMKNNLLSSTLSAMANKSMTPTVMKTTGDGAASFKVPDNTPTTPLMVKTQSTKQVVQFNMPAAATPANNNITFDMVNKNLFGTPLSSSEATGKPKIISEFAAKPSSKPSDVPTAAKTFGGTSTVDPLSFWGKGAPTKPVNESLTNVNVFTSEIPTGDSPESNQPEPSFLSNTTVFKSPSLADDTVVSSSISPTDSDENGVNDASTTQDEGVSQTSTVAESDDSAEKVVETTNDFPQEPIKGIPPSLSAFPGFISSKPTMFGVPSSTPGKSLFGGPVSSSLPFGSTSSPAGLFGASALGTSTAATTTSGLFGSLSSSTSVGPVSSSSTLASTGGLFGSKPSSGGGLFKSGTLSSSQPSPVKEEPAKIAPRVETPKDDASEKDETIVPPPTVPEQIPTNASSVITSTFPGSFASSSGDSKSASGGLFGTPSSSSSGLFGSISAAPATGGLFDSTSSSAAPSGGLLAASKSSGGLFGAAATLTTIVSSESVPSIAPTAKPSGGLFGTPASSASGGIFGAATSSVPSTGGIFSSTVTSSVAATASSTPSKATAGGLFGAVSSTTPALGGLFGTLSSAATTNTSGDGLFGAASTAPAGGIFGASTSTSSGGLFGSSSVSSASGNLFGSSITSTASGGLFSASSTTASSSGGLFGSTLAASTPSGGLFGSSTTSTASGGLFGASLTSTASGGLFGSSTTSTSSGGFFGSGGGLFTTPASSSGGVFGSSGTSASGGGFGSQPTTSVAPAFGSTGNSLCLFTLSRPRVQILRPPA